MLTVLDAIHKSTEYLSGKGIESPRMNAELLLANILDCKRLDLYLRFDSPLKDDEIDQYREAIARRGKFEPLQYITGKVDFFDLEFKINKNVLIPRPETELLIEQAIEYAGRKNIESILDIGTGSGNIAIALAKNLNGVMVTSVDLSEDAIDLAKENASMNSADSKIKFIVGDIFSFTSNEKYDMIISNPPYVSSDDYSKLQKEILDYEPKFAVTDSGDGYKFFNHIIKESNNLLNKKGILLFEMAKGQIKKIICAMEENDFESIKVVKDYQDIERIIVGEKK